MENYRQLDGLNQSMLKSFYKAGPSIFLAKKRKAHPLGSQALSKGQLVEDLLFLSKKEIKKKYTVKDFVFPTPNSIAYKLLIYGVQNKFPKIDTDEEVLNVANILEVGGTSYTDETKIDKLKECLSLYKALKNTKDKTIVSTYLWEDANKAAESLKSTYYIFDDKNLQKSVTVIGNINGILVKGQIDAIIKYKEVTRLLDLKTFGKKGSLYNWGIQCRELGYFIQGAFYTDIYKLLHPDENLIFSFVVVDKYNTCFTYNMSSKDYAAGKYGYMENGDVCNKLTYKEADYPGYMGLLDMYSWYTSKYGDDTSTWPLEDYTLLTNNFEFDGGVF